MAAPESSTDVGARHALAKPKAKGCVLRSRKWLRDLGALCLLFFLPLILFWPVTVGSKTLIPADNLYQWQPYRAFAEQQGVSLPPHNELLGAKSPIGMA